MRLSTNHDAIEHDVMVTFYHDVEQDIDCDVNPRACTAVVDELLRLEARHGITATYNVVGSLFESQPDLIARIIGAGHEVAFHSYSPDPKCDPSRYSAEVAACRATSASPTGYRSPRSQGNESTLREAWSQGFLWNAESDKATEPYFVHRGLVRLPIAGDDWRVFTGEWTLPAWVDRFGAALESRAYFGWGLHDSVFSSNPAACLDAYEQLIALARSRNALTATFSQAADLYRRSALAALYGATAATWTQRTRLLYRTRRFQEIIRAEVERLERPVLVDLGSGGGALVGDLAGLASAIYCVDNAAAMLEQLPERGLVRPVVGEVTDSTLPAGMADCVICARVLEYVYDPVLVAEEIRRIARSGRPSSQRSPPGAMIRCRTIPASMRCFESRSRETRCSRGDGGLARETWSAFNTMRPNRLTRSRTSTTARSSASNRPIECRPTGYSSARSGDR